MILSPWRSANRSKDLSVVSRKLSVASKKRKTSITDNWHPMSISTQRTKLDFDPRTVFNVPNQLTSIRLVLAIVLFCLIPYEHYLTAMWVFIVAAGTDWIDGFYARRYNQVTTLGRILDPFVDKIIICGTFISLAGLPDSG